MVADLKSFVCGPQVEVVQCRLNNTVYARKKIQKSTAQKFRDVRPTTPLFSLTPNISLKCRFG